MITPSHKRQISFLLGAVAGIHEVAKLIESEGVEGLDPVACAMEDVSGILEGLLHDDISDAEAMALNL